MAVVLSAPVGAGSVSSGGPWTYSNQYVTCKFTGDHGAQNGYAFGRTTDYNNGCAKLKVRLKSDPGATDWGWVTTPTASYAYIQFFDPRSGTTAVSSQHQAQEPWWESWSSVQQPHAF
jgi:hypothetical protein